MIWNQLSDVATLNALHQKSFHTPALIFKHSTRCSISASAKDKLERNWNQDLDNYVTPFYLDLLANRDLSDTIAYKYGVKHESPQVLVLINGEVVFHRSHLIQFGEILNAVKQTQKAN